MTPGDSQTSTGGDGDKERHAGLQRDVTRGHLGGQVWGQDGDTQVSHSLESIATKFTQVHPRPKCVLREGVNSTRGWMGAMYSL